MAKIVTGDEYFEVDGKLPEITRQLWQKNGYPFKLNPLEQYLQNTIEGKFDQAVTLPQSQTSNIVPGNQYLRCVSTGEKVIIPACDGSKIISESNVFDWKDEDFLKWKADERGLATPEVEVSVLEVIRNATFGQMLDINVRNLPDVNSADTQRLQRMILTQSRLLSLLSIIEIG